MYIHEKVIFSFCVLKFPELRGVDRLLFFPLLAPGVRYGRLVAQAASPLIKILLMQSHLNNLYCHPCSHHVIKHAADNTLSS